MKNGESREIKVTFPSDYHESRFANQEVIFQSKVKSIREKKLPAEDDSFVKNFQRYDSFEDFKTDVRKSLEEKAEQISKDNLQNSMIDQLIKENNFEVPESMVQKQIYYMMADTQKRMMSAGIDENSAMDFTMKMQDKYKGDAEKTVKSFLLLKKIAEKESLAAEDSDLEQYLQEQATQSGRDYESLKKFYENDERKDYLRTELVHKKVFDFIEQNANIKVVEKTGLNAEARQ